MNYGKLYKNDYSKNLLPKLVNPQPQLLIDWLDQLNKFIQK